MDSQKDFFISYNKADRQWAEWIGWTLEESGYSVVIQAWDFRPGGNFVLEMQKAASEAHKTIAVLSEDYLKSAFTQPEWAAAFAQDPQGQKGTLIPVRVQPCELSGILAPIIYVDLLNLEAEAAQETLIEALKERAKPFQKPQFPGSVDRVIPTPAVFPGHSSTPQNLPRSGVVEFVGRTQKLIDLHTQLQQNDRIAITAIAGMGGIGKTELALQYALAQKGEYPAGLCWLRARDQEIATQIVTFAQAHLGLTPPDQLEIEAQVRFCWQKWPEGDALVVLDDVTDYKAIEAYLPPPDPRFKLLITTRSQLGSSVKDFPVDELEEGGEIDLLQSLVTDGRIESQSEDAKILCEWVGGLPLALELLGRFLARKPDWTISRLLNALDDKRLDAKALITPETGMTATLGVAAALELSWAELSEQEQDLACLLGMFAVAPIPWNVIEQCVIKLSPSQQPSILSRLSSLFSRKQNTKNSTSKLNLENLEEYRDEGLRDRSLLKRAGEGTYQLHQVVQEYFREKLTTKNDTMLQNAFCGVMVVIAKSINQTPTIEEIEKIRSAIIHLEEVAKRWIGSVTQTELTWPYVGIGRFYEGQGNYGFAEPWYRKCLEETQSQLGNEHPDVSASLNNLAALYKKQGRYAEAEPLHQQALALRKKALGNEHPDVAGSLNNLAALYDDQGRYAEAEPLYLQALELRKKALGNEHPDVAGSLNNLALLYQNQGRYAEAEPLYLQALELRKKALGNEHPDVAGSLNNLALLYQKQDRYAEAEPLYLQALELRKKALGNEHPDVATSQLNLGALYHQQGEYQKARKLYRQAIAIAQASLGPNHPTTLTIISWLNSLPPE
jgi:tetratricopeptide (TPR) repeat protein